MQLKTISQLSMWSVVVQLNTGISWILFEISNLKHCISATPNAAQWTFWSRFVTFLGCLLPSKIVVCFHCWRFVRLSTVSALSGNTHLSRFLNRVQQSGEHRGLPAYGNTLSRPVQNSEWCPIGFPPPSGGNWLFLTNYAMPWLPEVLFGSNISPKFSPLVW